MLQRAATRCSMLPRAATRCNALPRAATRCSALQHTRGVTLQRTRSETRVNYSSSQALGSSPSLRMYAADRSLQHAATCYNALQHAATRCNTLQPAATYKKRNKSALLVFSGVRFFLITSTCTTCTQPTNHCNTQQHAATRCNMLQHAATRCNTLQRTRGVTRVRYSSSRALRSSASPMYLVYNFAICLANMRANCACPR